MGGHQTVDFNTFKWREKRGAYMFSCCVLGQKLIAFKFTMMERWFSTMVSMYFFLLCSNVALGQTTMNVSKSPCSDNSRYYIDVEVRHQGRLLDSSGRRYYDYSGIFRLADSVKIQIIESVFEFASDTSLCCNRVRMYENPDYSSCFSKMPLSDKFSIQIEALFIINRIAYWPVTYRVGCYPVLYDYATKQEVYNDPGLTGMMVDHYRQWFKMYKETGKLPPYDFMNEGRIRWWGKHLMANPKRVD